LGINFISDIYYVKSRDEEVFLRINVGRLKFDIAVHKVKKATGDEYSGDMLIIERRDTEDLYKISDKDYIKLSFIEGENSLLFNVEGKSETTPFSKEPLSLKVDFFESPGKILALTIYNIGFDYEKGFEYYNLVGLERVPSVPRPSDYIEYPKDPKDKLFRISSWAFPYQIDSFNKLFPYTIFILAKYHHGYLSILTLTNGALSAYASPNLVIETFSGKVVNEIKRSNILAIAYAERPYESIERLIDLVSQYTFIKHRLQKPAPRVLSKLGWCSWNALQLVDLSSDNIKKIVGGLVRRGVPVKWVIVDDGWQIEEIKELRLRQPEFGAISVRILKSLQPRRDKFPAGFRELIESVKRLGVEEIGLWHTINLHWGGAHKDVFNELGSEAVIDYRTGTHVPSPEFEKALDFFRRFFRYLREQGFDFVKIDNQYYIKLAYEDQIDIARASENIMISSQLAAHEHNMWILNSMAMNPENYSFMPLSNIARVSLDYIPLWRSAAKLHVMWSIFNSVFFSFITYPDYDMWMSYDPFAKLYAVASVLSGGPIYLTDRDPDKTNIDLLKKIVLPNGEVVRVDEPALPTEDSLFTDPYNETRLLKVASRSKDSIVIGVFNIYKDPISIRDSIDPLLTRYVLREGEYLYYKVFSGGYRLLKIPGDKIDIELGTNDAEIIILVPIKAGKAVVGIQEYLLPQYPIMYEYINDTYYVRSKISGTLIYYVDGKIKSMWISEKDVVQI